MNYCPYEGETKAHYKQYSSYIIGNLNSEPHRNNNPTYTSFYENAIKSY